MIIGIHRHFLVQRDKNRQSNLSHKIGFGTCPSYSFERKHRGEMYKLFYIIVHRKICIKTLYFKAPSPGQLIYLNNCVKKNVHEPFFARNACLPYRKNGFQAHFFRFAYFFRLGLFQLKLVALPRAIQSKRLGTTHFFCGGH